MNSKNLLIMVGAGASFDCGDSGTATTREDFHPLLTKDLFIHRGAVDQILHEWSKVEASSDEIRTRLTRDKISLETLLKKYQSETNIELLKQYWEIAYYLQQLLGTISDNYIIQGASKYESLVRSVVRSSYEKVIFATTNYDLFLDRALKKILSYEFSNFDDYVPNDKKCILIKLHGSVNWGKKILNEIKAAEPIDSALTHLTERLKVSSEFTHLNGYIRACLIDNKLAYYPALSIPVEGKSDFNCPEEHRKLFEAYLSTTTDFLFIGYSAKDSHITDLFSKVKTINKLKVVNSSNKGAISMLNELAKYNKLFQPISKEQFDEIKYTQGFKNFANNGEMDKFFR